MVEFTEILGNIGNFIGAIGVVVSLVYLTMQVRQSRQATDANTRALEDGRRLALAQTYQARSAALQEIFLVVAGSAELAEIETRVGGPLATREEFAAGYATLSAVEQMRLRYYLNAHRVRLDNLLFQYEQGFLTDEYYDAGVRRPMRRFAPHWEVAGIPIELLTRRGFVTALHEIVATDPAAPRRSAEST